MTTIKPLLGNSVLCIVCHRETFVKKTDFVTLFWILVIKNIAITGILRPRGPTDTASDFESEDCGFESHRGQRFSIFSVDNMIVIEWSY